MKLAIVIAIALLPVLVSAPTQLLQRKSPAFFPGGGAANGLLTSLAGYWDLDETSTGSAAVQRDDSHSGALHLNDTNTTASGTGLLNNGADFENGSTEYLSRTGSDTGVLTSGTNIAISISAWCKLESTNASRLIASKDLGTSNNREYSILYSTTNNRFNYNIGRTNSSTIDGVVSTNIVALDTWYHVAGVFDPSANTIKIYVNNAPTTAGSKTIDPPSTAAKFSIGSLSGTVTFDGIVDEVAVWRNRALSDADVTLLYNSGTPLPYSSFN